MQLSSENESIFVRARCCEEFKGALGYSTISIGGTGLEDENDSGQSTESGSQTAFIQWFSKREREPCRVCRREILRSDSAKVGRSRPMEVMEVTTLPSMSCPISIGADLPRTLPVSPGTVNVVEEPWATVTLTF